MHDINPRRVALGFVLAPLAGFAATGLVFQIAFAFHHGFAEYGRRTPIDAADLGLAYALSVVAGLPLFLFFKAFGFFKFWQSLVAGLVLGSLLSLSLTVFTADRIGIVDLQGLVLCAFLGGVTTTTFWLVAIRPGKPERPARPG